MGLWEEKCKKKQTNEIEEKNMKERNNHGRYERF